MALEIKGFITNLGKYNEGELIGEWVTFPISAEEEAEIFERIGINEFYEEYFFTDYEYEFEADFSEYASIAELNEICEELEEWKNYEDEFCAATEIYDFDEAMKLSPFDCLLLTDVNDDYDLGYYYAVECDCIQLTEAVERYFNFEAYGRDIRLETNGDFTYYGYFEYLR